MSVKLERAVSLAMTLKKKKIMRNLKNQHSPTPVNTKIKD